MIIRKLIGVGGKEIIEMIPETPDDESVLAQMAEQDTIDNREGFTDAPKLWDDLGEQPIESEPQP